MKRKSIAVMLILVVVLAFAGCGANKSTSGEADYSHLDANEAASLIESGECVLVDVRSEEEYKIEHIPGAVNIPHDSGDESFEAALPDKNQRILLYCDYGGVSKDTAEHLCKDLGYTNVSEFDGLLVWEGDTERG